MSLPKIAVPKYDLELPSGKKIKYRPFLVGEQKLILQAIEMGDENAIQNATNEVLAATTFGEVNLDELPVYDVEYLMLMLRARSVGDRVEMKYRCNNMVEKADDGLMGKCGAVIPVAINLNDVQVVGLKEREYTVKLTETIGVKMRDLPYGAYRKNVGEPSVQRTMEMMYECVDFVYDGDEIYSRKDFTQAELQNWIEDLPDYAIEQVDNFMETMPQISLTINLKCKECGNTETITLVGLDDFLD